MVSSKALGGVMCALMLAAVQGCSTQPIEPGTHMSAQQIKAAEAAAARARALDAFKRSDTQVDALMAKGRTEDAVGALKQVAGEYPQYGQPWNRLAKIYFDQGKYGKAIEAANEVLKRDSANQDAKVIQAVSGLRIAAQSLIQLRNDAELKGSARQDAISLVKVMHETLGEDIFASTEAKHANVRAVRKKKRNVGRWHYRRRVPQTEKKTNSAPPASNDPFGALR